MGRCLECFGLQDFRQLQVWEKAHQVTLAAYKMTKSFPQEEVYGLTSQIRRASVSVGANIAEGGGRRGDAEFARFLQIAMGSASELDYLLLVVRDLALINEAGYAQLAQNVTEVKRMLASLIQKLRAKSRS